MEGIERKVQSLGSGIIDSSIIPYPLTAKALPNFFGRAFVLLYPAHPLPGSIRIDS